MGVYIKGMDMPKSCWECEIFGCSLRDKLAHIEDRNPDCPLVEIPTPHGRLIDELKRHRDEYANDHGWNTSVLEALDTTITILEAERRTDEHTD